LQDRGGFRHCESSRFSRQNSVHCFVVVFVLNLNAPLAHFFVVFVNHRPTKQCFPRQQNWEEAIKQSLLFLFLGYFGGKNSFSRHLLLWGAPLSFALQARPVKMWFKIAFYMMSNPPLILLSFLPAPQQAILSVDLRASCVALYGEDGADRILGGAAVSKRVGSDGSPSTTIPEDEEESDVDDEEDDDEYDSEEEDEDDSDWEEE